MKLVREHIVLYLLIASTLLAFKCHSQNTLKVKFSDITNNDAQFIRMMGDKYKLIEKLIPVNHTINYTFPKNSNVGMYRIILGGNSQNQKPVTLDFIYNKENIEIEADSKASLESVNVVQSNENLLYYDFLKKENEFQKKLELLQPLISFYPEEDDVLTQAKKKYNSLQKEREQFINKLAKQNENTFASKIIRSYKSPFLDAYITDEEREKAFKDNYFKQLDFSDTTLMNSDVYTNKTIRYLMLYRNQNFSQTEQENAFIKAVDIIMANTNNNAKVSEFITDYLVRGFEQFKMENVLKHISENYLNKRCETENKSTLQIRLESYQKMAVGKIATEVELIDMNGNKAIIDSSIDYTLLIFWVSWCPHCNEMLPKLAKSELLKNIQIFTVSLDTNKTDWQNSIKQFPVWKNYCDFKGWNGKTVTDYNIYATPTMFLLDKKRKILAKPITFEELIDELKKL